MNIKDFIQKDFLKNILTLMSGTVVAQIINLAAIPILSRLFTPNDFGVFAVYFALSSILASISCGRYELAIMLPKKDINAYQIVIISFFFLVIITVLSFIIIFLFFHSISDILKVKDYKYLIFLVPVLTFLIGSHKILNNWFSRFKSFKPISVSKIIKSGTSVSVKSIFGVFSFHAFGLFIGEISGQIFSVLFLLKKNKKIISENSFYKDTAVLKQELKENKNFPFFSMPMAFLNSVSVQILIYFLTFLFNTTIVGFYIQANKVLNYPLSLISNSFTSVFYQKLTTTNKQIKLYVYSYLTSVIIAAVISFPIYFWGEELFGFVLGNNWRFSGFLAKFLIPIVIFGFATRNTSVVFSFLKLQQITLIWQVLYLISAFGIFFYFKTGTLDVLIKWFSLTGGFLYLLLGFIGYFLLIRQKKKHK
ncbi:MAG: oligosaccharide flippase family protein [Chlorobi bacterium]|nr:oligosaccharide flippase family protein [Chlorobiota bacterium]